LKFLILSGADKKRCIAGDDAHTICKSVRPAGVFFGVVSSLVLALSAH